MSSLVADGRDVKCAVLKIWSDQCRAHDLVLQFCATGEGTVEQVAGMIVSMTEAEATFRALFGGACSCENSSSPRLCRHTIWYDTDVST